MKKTAILITAFSVAVIIAGCADYSLRTSAEPSVLSRGGSGKLTVFFKAHGKYHLDPNGMVLIIFEPPAGITVEKAELRQEDKIKLGTFETKISVSPTAAQGTIQITTKVMFQLCTKELCRLINEERQIPITIK